MSDPTTPTGKALRTGRLVDLDPEDILAIEAEARQQERERLRDPDLWTEAGLLDGYLNIRGVENEARALELLSRDMDCLLAEPSDE
jgi:hypothetical protein